MIRYWLNSVLGVKCYTAHYASPSPEKLIEVSSKVLKFLFGLINKKRKDVKPVATYSLKWNCIPEAHVLRNEVPSSNHDTLIPLIDSVKLLLSARN